MYKSTCQDCGTTEDVHEIAGDMLCRGCCAPPPDWLTETRDTWAEIVSMCRANRYNSINVASEKRRRAILMVDDLIHGLAEVFKQEDQNAEMENAH